MDNQSRQTPCQPSKQLKAARVANEEQESVSCGSMSRNTACHTRPEGPIQELRTCLFSFSPGQFSSTAKIKEQTFRLSKDKIS